jgi:hypothetical protein
MIIFLWSSRGKRLAEGVDAQALWDLSTCSEASNLPAIRGKQGSIAKAVD